MKKLIIFILAFVPFVTRAHQDTYRQYEYQNVTVRFLTGFFFEEINNAKIIGQYAALLCDSMGYDKPILLDFIHDYGYSHNGRTYSFLNFGSEKYELVSYYMQDSIQDNLRHMIPYSDTVESIKNVDKEVYTVPGINRRKTIVVRQLGFHFDVTQTMNLLYYALTNKARVKKLARTDTLQSYLRNTYYRLESLPSRYIDSITNTTFPYVQQVLENKIYRDVDTIDRHRLYYSYYSQHGQITVFAGLHDKEIILDTLDRIYTFYPREVVPELLFVFTTPVQFRRYELNTWAYPEYEAKRSKLHAIPFDPYEYILFVNIEWLGDDIYFINYDYSFMHSPFIRFPYLADDDVLIEDFEAYVNSYRTKEK